MIALNNGDKIKGDASVAAKIDYTLHGVVSDIITQIADGQLGNAEATLYETNSDGTIVTTIILVNTHTSAITCNLYLKPNGGTSRRIIPKDMEIGAGYILTFDGVNLAVTNQQGNVVFYVEGDTAATPSGYAHLMKQADDTLTVPLVDADGHVQVDVLSGGDSNDSIATEGVAATKGTQIALDDGTDSHYAQANASGDLKVTLDSEAVILGVGSAAIGKLAANSGVDIGDVDVTSLPALPAGNNNIGDVDIASALPAGTNAIGKLAANSGVDIGDVDVISQPADTFAAEDAALGKGVLLQGDDGTDRHNVAVDASGNLQTDIVGALPAGSAKVGVVDVGMLNGTWTCISVNINTATTTELKAAVAGHTYTVITVSFTVAAGNNLTWKSASTAISGPMDFGQSGEPKGWQANLWPCGLKCTTGEALNLTTSTTGQVSGFICVLDES